MQKFTTLQRSDQNPLIGIVRAADADAALHLAEACIAGGVTVLEVSLTTPDGLDGIRSLVKRHKDNALLGAGCPGPRDGAHGDYERRSIHSVAELG